MKERKPIVKVLAVVALCLMCTVPMGLLSSTISGNFWAGALFVPGLAASLSALAGLVWLFLRLPFDECFRCAIILCFGTLFVKAILADLLLDIDSVPAYAIGLVVSILVSVFDYRYRHK